ncbi:MAG: hypothetical protein OXD01_04045 [Gammaproteobacteria bacterium]|nr:hypothetical protein [Gammaproteobacteria bacterium]
MDQINTVEVHMIVFESDASKTWKERISRREEAEIDPMVFIWGC